MGNIAVNREGGTWSRFEKNIQKLSGQFFFLGECYKVEMSKDYESGAQRRIIGMKTICEAIDVVA